ncbi:hypothetical protein EDM56_19900 [Brevibacillus fluminis]|uniref:Uncharacterized protein n=2 Tax=Brevibacillus fluminis TaxID=511487 RepID=A0A3M8DAS2_9BACL|nr:hypothetical protein EDM56_19900 [Brevibacillus fluminis]
MDLNKVKRSIQGAILGKREELIYWHDGQRKAVIEIFDCTGDERHYGIQATISETGETFSLPSGFAASKLEGLNEIVALIEQRLLRPPALCHTDVQVLSRQ